MWYIGEPGRLGTPIAIVHKVKAAYKEASDLIGLKKTYIATEDYCWYEVILKGLDSQPLLYYQCKSHGFPRRLLKTILRICSDFRVLPADASKLFNNYLPGKMICNDTRDMAVVFAT